MYFELDKLALMLTREGVGLLDKAKGALGVSPCLHLPWT